MDARGPRGQHRKISGVPFGGSGGGGLKRTFEQRLWSRILLGDDCWEWTGCRSAKGYGLIYKSGATKRVHRVVYELLVGPIPDGLQLDHLCRNRGCANPSHLDPVDTRENTLRGVGLTSQNAVKTHCAQGHPFTGENLYLRTGSRRGRECRECKRNWDRKRRLQLKEGKQ